MKVVVIGTGYVGLTVGLCISKKYDVICIDKDKNKIERLQKGIPTIYENHLNEILNCQMKCGKIFFSTDIENALKEADIVFITVGTPMKENGEADIRDLWEVGEQIKQYGREDTAYVIKSTVPVGTTRKFQNLTFPNKKNVIFNPEFLREGSAIIDFLQQERIVFGTLNEENVYINRVVNMYKNIQVREVPIIITGWETAELIKYASNTYLAVKLSYVNELADLCEKVSADIETVTYAMGLDQRIGNKFLKVGPGYGGSCFPKDVSALLFVAHKYNCELSIINAAQEVNNSRKYYLLKKMKKVLGEISGKRIAIMGITFKANTDDLRESPAIKIIDLLVREKARVCVFDPCYSENDSFADVHFANDILTCVTNVDAIVIMTEWEEFVEYPWQDISRLVKNKLVFDFRNLLEPDKIREMGFAYISLGRK